MAGPDERRYRGAPRPGLRRAPGRARTPGASPRPRAARRGEALRPRRRRGAHRFRGRGGPDAGPHRAERSGQDDHAAADAGPPDPGRGRGPVLRRSRSIPDGDARRQMGYVVQDGGLFPHLTAAQNVALVARHLRWRGGAIDARRERAGRAGRLPGRRAGTATRRSSPADSASAWASCARSSSTRAPAPRRAARRARSAHPRRAAGRPARRSSRDSKKAVIIVTHDLAEAAFFADELVLLRDGRVVQAGAIEDLVQRRPSPSSRGSWRRSARCTAAGRRAVTARRRCFSASRSPAGAAGARACAASGVGSKAFAESVILGEWRGSSWRPRGSPVEHRRALGGTRLLLGRAGAGRPRRLPRVHRHAARRRSWAARAAGRGLAAPRPWRSAGSASPVRSGSTTPTRWAMRAGGGRARLGHPDHLRPARTIPSCARPQQRVPATGRDGWPGLRAATGCRQRDVRGLDHDLAYRGLAAGAIDVTDLYSTDAEIRRAWAARAGRRPRRLPRVPGDAALPARRSSGAGRRRSRRSRRLEGQISAPRMIDHERARQARPGARASRWRRTSSPERWAWPGGAAARGSQRAAGAARASTWSW